MVGWCIEAGGLSTLNRHRYITHFCRKTRTIRAFVNATRLQVSKVVVEPYNAVFSTSHLVANSDETFFVDNEALHDICLHTLKLTAASYQEMNLLISAAMAGNTSFCFIRELN